MLAAVRQIASVGLLLPLVAFAQTAPTPALAPGGRMCPCPDGTPGSARTPGTGTPTTPGTGTSTSPAPQAGTAAPQTRPFIEPVLGANAITLGWNPSFAFPASSELAPSVRLGVLRPNLFADLRFGFSTAIAPTNDFSGMTSVSLDAEVGTCPYSRDEDRICGSAGLGGGLLLGTGPSDYVTPTTSLTVGVGLKH